MIRTLLVTQALTNESLRCCSQITTGIGRELVGETESSEEQEFTKKSCQPGDNHHPALGNAGYSFSPLRSLVRICRDLREVELFYITQNYFSTTKIQPVPAGTGWLRQHLTFNAKSLIAQMCTHTILKCTCLTSCYSRDVPQSTDRMLRKKSKPGSHLGKRLAQPHAYTSSSFMYIAFSFLAATTPARKPCRTLLRRGKSREKRFAKMRIALGG